jgi:bis(5'-nucleosyl)-tetraphosphatase (symmetrical)
VATYAIGDVQGCYDELQDLLRHISFDADNDTLWFAGDLVNRGPNSLEVLRFVKGLPSAVVVLGNHDLHLLSIANGHPFKDHALHDVLVAPDRDELMQWLREQPLLHYDKKLGYALVHAGIPPQWSLKQAIRHAAEVEQVLQSERYAEFLEHLYGNKPSRWSNSLKGWSRLRFITNALTRLRFCDPSGKLDFSAKGRIGMQPTGFLPWFKVPGRATEEVNILFGHWAALEGKTDTPRVFALDTGCVWGNTLTAMRLEDAQLFSVRCRVTKLKE